MSKTTKPKRIKRWVNVYDGETGYGHASANVARQWADKGATRVAVPLIELRRGEVVVDVEALVEAFLACDGFEGDGFEGDLRAAIKKVGVR